MFGVAPERAGRDHRPAAAAAGGRRSGVATSMLAAYVPARNAARVEPVQALQKGNTRCSRAGENRMRRRRRLACASRSRWLCLGFGSVSRRFLSWAMRWRCSSALLLVPLLSQALVKVLRRAAEVAAAGRRIAGRRQPAAGAAAHFGHGRRAGALAGAGDRTGRHGARQLSIDRRVGQQHAQSRSVRLHVAELRVARFPLSRVHGERTDASARGRRGAAGPLGAHAVPRICRSCWWRWTRPKCTAASSATWWPATWRR